MNREIKFRGKRIDNGEWVYGNLIYSSDAYKEYETLIIPQRDADGFTTDYASNGENKESYGFDNWFCVIPETVGQYTGLKDKNGKEIFEGDIVFAIATYDCANTVVIWDDGGFVLVPCKYYKNYISRCGYKDIRFLDKEVVGNIYENKELLQN